MDRLFRERDAGLIVTWLSLVEIEPAFAVKIRSGAVEAHEATRARRALELDLQSGRLLAAPRPDARLYEAARTLVVRFGVSKGLRALDALQLAAAIHLRRNAGLSAFVTAGHRLRRAAELAGCPTLDPEAPDVLVSR